MINYEISGDGKPLVLLHGWGFDRNIWKPIVPHLSDFKIYLVDLPGFGNTPYMDWEIFKQELLKILPTKFIVLGWSLGGLFATRLVIEEPDRVEKFVNVTASPRFVSAKDWVGIEESAFANFHMQFLNSPQKTRYNFLHSQLLEDTGLDLGLTDDLDIEGLAAGLDILTSWDLRAPLHNVKQPGLFVFGKLDAIVNQKVMPILKNNYPNFEYVMFRRAAHVPFLSHTSEFIELIIKFCL